MHHLIGSSWYYKAIERFKQQEFIATWMMAKTLGSTTAQARRLLKIMEDCEIVERSELSQRNNIIWRLKTDATRG